MSVKLKDIVDALEMQSEDCTIYLNRATGDVIYITPDSTAEEEEAVSCVGTPYLPLPTQYEVHEYQIMERFVAALTNRKIAEDLSDAMRGSGAFRRFKDKLAYWNIQEHWYDYRDKALNEIAVRWCAENDVAYQGKDKNKTSSLSPSTA